MFFGSTGHMYPAPSSLDDVRCNENVGLFFEAPWLDCNVLVEKDLVSHYDIYGLLPGDIPVGCVTLRAWLESCCSGPGDLLVYGSRTVAGVRRNFSKALYYWLFSLRNVIMVEQYLGLDMQIYRAQR